MNTDEAQWSVEDQEAGYGLPARFFYDEAVFQREKTRIFFKSWHLVGHANELREPGAFLTHEIFEQSVIVIAGHDREIRAFHNVCQHRGNRLVEARRGKSPILTCGYHAWSYALDGCLRGAPNTQGLAGFNKSEHGLKPIRVAVFASFVFVNLDPAAKPISELAPDAEVEIRHYLPDLDRLALIEEIDVPVPANWKVIQENSIEGYHFDNSGPAHKQLVQLIDFPGYTLKSYGNWWTYIGPPSKDATHAYGVPLDGATWQTDSFFNFGLWPNATIYAFPYADMVGTFIMNPTGAESSVLRFGYYAAAGKVMPDVTRACIRWMNEDLGPEDIKLNKSNQKGLRSFGFKRGRYVIGEEFSNRSEHLVRHFHKLCYDAVRS
jgi:phenylpropionate dioxygenase-like ring-hydroxylating dioxygenase large terminal subunit